MMEWSTWEPFYNDITKRLGIDPHSDYAATSILSELVHDMDPTPLLNNLRKTIQGRTVIVYGSGPSLVDHIEFLQSKRLYEDAVHVAADGAISAIIETKGKCQIIVTDLDGNPDDILSTISQGSVPVVHAHGDNIPQIQKYVSEMSSVIGSTQVEPLQNVFLWGGFTDGDRACFLVSYYHPDRIILAGMDFGSIVGKWSKPSHSEHFPASERKKAKLGIAQELLQYLWSTNDIIHEYVQDMER